MAIDSQWANVVALLLFEGANNSTSIVDVKQHAFTAAGNAKITTSDYPFGASGSCLTLDGTGDYVSATGASDFALGSGDFIVEVVFKTTDNNCCLVDFFSSGNAGWQINITSGGKLNFYSASSIKTGGVTVNDGAWRYAAVTRASGSIHFYTCVLGGTLAEDGSGTSNSTNFSYVASTFAIGAQVATRNTTYDFSGTIGPVRITKGTARPGFTLPSALFLCPTISGVVLNASADPVAKIVSALKRSTMGSVVAVLSDGASGAYKLRTIDYSEHVVMEFDTATYPLVDGGSGENALIYDRVIPGG